MSSVSPQAMVNQSLFEDQETLLISSQLGFFPLIPINHTSFPLLGQTLKNLTPISPPSVLPADSPITLSDQSMSAKQKQEFTFTSPLAAGSQNILSNLQRPSASNYWAWGELGDCMSMKRSHVGDDHLGISTVRMKKIKGRRKVREPRFCFKTMSDVDVLDDGYKWRKYGQKVVKNTQHPRSYYRCTQDNCRVKKRVERLAEDPRMVITTYEGRHIHSPSLDEDDSSHQASTKLNNFFW